MGLIGVRRGGRTVMPAPIESPSNTKNRKPGFAPGFPQWTTTPGRQRSGLQLPEGCATHSPHGALVRRDSQVPREGGRNTAIFGVDPETRLARMWKSRSDPVLHIDLRRWADLLLVAPLDANTLGKVASGICDNLLTCVIRAWDRSKPLLFCPAMNTAMWEHPITAQQVDQLKAFGYVEIPCVAKKLVCGDEGLGAMAEVGTIVDKVKEVLFQHSGFQQS
ncbi:phosphopantothenoylcysteine decarboxylase isoform X7 [Macaca fascicularis]|uniref:phosphopantothenoylcysteine decarboxylase isoform X7 n=1 Tax=Macaca fascicularis TaxID=9541 RepID=UPI003D15773A